MDVRLGVVKHGIGLTEGGLHAHRIERVLQVIQQRAAILVRAVQRGEDLAGRLHQNRVAVLHDGPRDDRPFVMVKGSPFGPKAEKPPRHIAKPGLAALR